MLSRFGRQLFSLRVSSQTASLISTRTYKHKRPPIPYGPIMPAVSQSDILSRLAKLGVSHDAVIEHGPAANGAQWTEALDKAQGSKQATLTKTLLFKPKTAKSAVPNPVLVLASEQTETSSSAIARLLNLKDLRLASEDLIKDVLPGVGSKDDVSALLLPAPLSPNLHVLLDSTLASSDALYALHVASSSETILLKGTDVKAYINSLRAEDAPEVSATSTGVREVDFAALKAQELVDKPEGVTKEGKPAPVEKKAKGAAAAEEPKFEMAIQYKKDVDFPGWYTDVLLKGQMLDYYDISGCYILRPWSYSVWQTIQNWFDDEIKKLGVQDCYFPMFVSKARLEKEKDHIEGFAPEVAWVTKAGNSDLEEHIAIRPTSETVMYPYYAKWITSHRDLPLKLNQWNSVVRWEFKNPQPFLRTREFLWQEGHTAFLTEKEAGAEVLDILDLYRRVYEELLAVPVIPGVKSENEKFAGGHYTTTVEGFIPTTGRGIQGATSHCLGQNFSKMFNIVVEDPAQASKKEKVDVGAGPGKVHLWQNSWGLSTRSIGVMVMVHGDDQGLVMPPRVSLVQVVIVPVGLSKVAGNNESIYDACAQLEKDLIKAGVRAKADLREGYTPGWKFNDWEMRGVPLRLELGPRDIANKSTQAVRRYDNHKFPLALEDIATTVPAQLEEIQKGMLQRAKVTFDERIKSIREWSEVVPALDAKNVIVFPWCEGSKCEDDIKERSKSRINPDQAEDEKAPSMGAKSLCIPFDQARFGEFEADQKCIACGEKAKRWTMFGRSY